MQRGILEPTGRYRRRVHQSLASGGFEVAMVNPLRSRRFAESLGELAKTDRTDAAVLAKLGAAMPKLEATKPMDGFEDKLEALLVARSSLVGVRTSVG